MAMPSFMKGMEKSTASYLGELMVRSAIARSAFCVNDDKNLSEQKSRKGQKHKEKNMRRTFSIISPSIPFHSPVSFEP